jgi:pantoate--beta-alanine ligase
VAAVVTAARTVLDSAAVADPPLVTDYLALTDPATFAPVGADYAGDALLLVAAKVRGTRLIDNMALTIGGGT